MAKQNPERDTIIRGEVTEVETDNESSHFKGKGTVPMPAKEVFTDSELNRLTEVRRNSPEQENNRKSGFSVLSDRVRRQVNDVLNKAFPITPRAQIVRGRR